MNFIISKKRTVVILLLGGLSLVGCQSKNEKIIQVKNTATIDRIDEVVSLDLTLLKGLQAKAENIEVINPLTSQTLLTQLIDLNADGVYDELLFQASVKANDTQDYVLINNPNKIIRPKEKVTTYSRLVPERTDDYTWENDKVAFRTFGPEAQRRIEANEPGGTLSSGIDLWLKRVSYSIIDKWYAENNKKPGYYHVDHGEGCDPYHVGKSRGTGGIGIWENDSLLTSKNFIGYKTIATGPLRTVFELDYEAWSSYKIKETKRITLDLGTNFSKFEIQLESEQNVPNYTIAITLHEKKGETYQNVKEGWFRHWEPMEDSYLGEGIVIVPNVVEQAFPYFSEIPDQSQLLVITQPQNMLTFYAGFAWVKGGQVKTKADWDAMLKRQAIVVGHPLELIIKE